MCSLAMEEQNENAKAVMLFGRDVSRIPCFRSSFLYGIGGGLGVGLATFMFTSQPRLASHYAVGSFAVITLSYWAQCRYKYSKTKFEMAQLKAGMQRHVLYEGTHIEREVIKDNAKEC